MVVTPTEELRELDRLRVQVEQLKESLEWALRYRIPEGREPSTDNPLHKSAHKKALKLVGMWGRNSDG